MSEPMKKPGQQPEGDAGDCEDGAAGADRKMRRHIYPLPTPCYNVIMQSMHSCPFGLD